MSDEVRNTYNSIADAYAAKRRDPLESAWNRYLEMPAIRELLAPLAGGKRSLDLGCGTGILGEVLSTLGATEVVGVDQSEEVIRIGRKENPGALFEVASCEKLPFPDGRFDLVASSLMLHYLQDLRPTLREVHRVLKTSGDFVFSIHHPLHDRQAPYFHNEPYYWKMCGRDILSYHHTFESILDGLHKAGFITRTVKECRPDVSTKKDFKDYEQTAKFPTFLAVWASKTASS